MSRYTWYKASKEAIVDTLIATGYSIPLNYILIRIAFHYEMTAEQITVFFTAFFMVMGIVRKTLTRMAFDKKHHDRLENDQADT